MSYGRYKILRELGRGSMGVVFQAHDPHIDRMVALKVLRQDRSSSGAFVYRFMREARAIGRLSHPNIVTVYDIAESDGTAYISMEYLEGKSLDEVIKIRDFSLLDMIDLGIAVAEALDYAHRKGVVHRDVKPSNIIVQPDGRIKITDFGIARIEDAESTHQTQAGVILGTPCYMSPEQASGGRVDGRSDLFSLGVILYEIAARERPFKGESLTGVLHAITSFRPPELSSLNSQFPADLSQVIQKCLAKEPDRRFSSGKEVSDALGLCRESMGRSTAEKGASAKRQRGSPLWAGGISALLVLLTGASLYIWLGSGRHWQSGIREIEPPKEQGSHIPLPAPPVPLLPQGQWPEEQSSTKPLPPTSTKTDTPPATGGAAGSVAGRNAAGEAEQVSPALSAIPGSPRGADQEVLRQPPAPTLPGGSGVIPAGYGLIAIQTFPPGAEILVDGKYRGLTPLKGEISAGPHLVEALLDDHANWEAQVEVAENKETPLLIELLPLK